MKIAVDAMGGDYAPEAIVEGALLAKPQCPADLVLFGDETRIREVLGRSEVASSIQVVHAPQTIGMGEAGPVAIRRKRDASLSMAMRFLAEGSADAVVSAGNSSALVATAKHYIGLAPGLRRPAIAVPIPTPAGKVLLLDAGAYAATDTVHLAQSAALAHVYLKVTEGLDHPRIGLLNIGQEPGKGTKAIQRAFTLLKRSRLRFAGNVEPYNLFAGEIDAAICDGFVGNVLLKVFEAMSETFIRLLDIQVGQCVGEVREKLRSTSDLFHGLFLGENMGGAPLLGVGKAVLVAHGHSQGPAVANAIGLAFNMANDKVYERMQAELEGDPFLIEMKHYNTLLTLENLKNKWGFAQSDD
ncbi:MAG: phosphate acyltransferase PlsX [Syntrophobacteraceae bacterium]